MTTTTDQGSELSAIISVPGQIISAWADHDADAFARVFVEDGTMTMPGVYLKGHDQIRAFMAERFEGEYKGTQVTGTPLDFILLSDTSVVLVSEGGVMQPGETEVSDAAAIRAYWVLVKRDGLWKLAAYQNTPRDAA